MHAGGEGWLISGHSVSDIWKPFYVLLLRIQSKFQDLTNAGLVVSLLNNLKILVICFNYLIWALRFCWYKNSTKLCFCFNISILARIRCDWLVIFLFICLLLRHGLCSNMFIQVLLKPEISWIVERILLWSACTLVCPREFYLIWQLFPSTYPLW